jgi:hypothetical protein
MTTFKQQLTVSEELVHAMALDLGYKSEYEWEENGEKKVAQNPQTPEQFIDELAKQNTINFFVPFGLKLVESEFKKLGFEEQERQIREQLKAQIMQPVIDTLVTEIEEI